LLGAIEQTVRAWQRYGSSRLVLYEDDASELESWSLFVEVGNGGDNGVVRWKLIWQ